MYILEPYGGSCTRHTCPGCAKEKSFTRYIEKNSGKYLSNDFGRCNREINCGYHKFPNIADGQNTKYLFQTTIQSRPTETDYIPEDVLNRSLKTYENNHLVTFLISLTNKEIAMQLVSRYRIGTSKYWPGATIFWQIDKNLKARTGKIMLYSSVSGTRVREPHNHITWVHKLLKKPDYRLKQCFFGSHLLNDDLQKPVGIVESEKTALIASAYLPEMIWLASGGLNNLHAENLIALEGRKVILFPDLNCLDKWRLKTKSLSGPTSIQVSDFLQNYASQLEKEQGLDLADFLIRKI